MGPRDDLNRLLRDAGGEHAAHHRPAADDDDVPLDEEMHAEIDAAARRVMAHRRKHAAPETRDDADRESVLAAAAEVAASPARTFWPRLNEAQRAELLSMATAREFAAREVLFHAGEAASGAFVIVAGWVRIIAPAHAGQEGVTVALRGPGDLVGEGGVLCAIPRGATVQALGGGLRALEVPGELFSAFLEGDPLVARLVERIIWRRLRDADELSAIVATASRERRLASVLCKLAEWHRELHSPPPPPVGGAGETPLSLPLTVMDLASMSALPLGTVEGVTRRWEQRGVLQAGATGIAILRPSALDELRTEPAGETTGSGGSGRESRAARAREMFRQFQTGVLQQLEHIPESGAPG